MESENHLDVKQFDVAQITHELVIKSEKDEVFEIHKELEIESDLNKNSEATQIIHGSNDKANDYNYSKPWIKCEAVEELKLENSLDTDGITEITEECVIKDENAHFVKEGVSHKLHTCTHCNESFRKKSSLDGHIFKKHPEFESSFKFNVCFCCNSAFKTKQGLDDHIINKHPEYIAFVSSETYECSHCVFRTTIKRHLTKHMKKHPGNEGGCVRKTCIHCKATFKNKNTLDNHIIGKHPEDIASVSSKIHKCKFCAFKTTRTDRLAKHIKKHPEAEGDCKRNTCLHCNCTFKNRIGLYDHIIEKHPEYSASVSNRIQKCKHCRYKTASKKYLVSHIAKNHGANAGCRLKTCIHCSSTFKHQISLDDHIVKKHPEHIASASSKIHECKPCTYKTTLKGQLTTHMHKHIDAERGDKLSIFNASR
ncbi:unnamed protein product [Acanthoscelides obtectus]|uniref:C2H2-type domain-containing protein n=1 Tax=Acanthoscelides obtectus TaxID=200917 RepID=A0A9P0PG06_ACAOB|nr:unnamed protein product [Acanthoscelides obtectus]CAK1676871.1 Zinc finger protein 711 [Acanthoscelides obtectus]